MAEITFGEWLRRERKLLRLTQAELAAQVGCSAIALRKIEAEERRPSPPIIDRLAGIFAVAPADRAAFLRFARGDWQAAPASILTGVAWHVERATPGPHLPAPVTSFVGREQDVAKVDEYLSDPAIRLVTLIGAPGIGKTRLSLQAAAEVKQDFADGVFFVPLAPISDPALVAPTIAQALGLVQTDQRSPLARLIEGIADRQILIVLDNFEQVIEAAPLASELLAACPRLKLIVTSRESLRVPGEWLYRVPPLSLPDEHQVKELAADAIDQFSALRLFAERARAVRSDFALAPENLRAVAAICRRLDGLPLAIELIAARVRMTSPPALLSNLTSDFTLHADGMRGVSARQKTLHNAIAWSYALLSRDEQALLARLSVFSGGFTLDAAQAVAQTSDVIAGLTSLTDKSLVVKTFEVNGEARFNLLVMIREFALDRLREMNVEAALRDRHAGYFLDLAERADREIHGPQQVEWMDRLELEYDNLRAALEWFLSQHTTEASVRLLGSLCWSWRIRDHDQETFRWFDKFRTLPDISAYPEHYARLLNQIGRSSWQAGDFRQARLVLEKSQAIWLRLGVDGERGLAEALSCLGLVARSGDSDYQMAQTLFERSLDLYQKHGDRWGIAFVLCNLGSTGGNWNDEALARSMIEQSLDLFRQLGDMWGTAQSAQWLGQLCLEHGNYENARFYLTEGLRLKEALRNKEGMMTALLDLGELYRDQGDYDQATQFYEKSLLLCQEFGLSGFNRGYAIYALGMIALCQRDYPSARQHFIDMFNFGRLIFPTARTCDLLTALAAVAAGVNQSERAAKLHGAALALFETTDYRIRPIDRTEYDRHIQLAREQLGEARFAALQAKGRTMTLEQSIEYALSGDTE